ncbi:MAG: CDP-alcohol phosphatidyltransferase family protein [Firmicutes bacterium]|nr:CDP-alcohol phosphatidyltransferase family protein [Bacillota bacterium]
MKIAKHIPNALAIMRIAICIALIFIPDKLGVTWIVLFIVAGVSDMIDGTLARKIPGAKSQLGAILDSVADMIMVIVAIVFFMPVMDIWGWLFWGYIAALSFKIMSGFVGYAKHKETVLLHTYSNKLLGFLLFIIPILYWFLGTSLGLEIYITFVFAAIFIITFEEILINLLLDKPSRDIKSIFGVRAANEKFRQENPEKQDQPTQQ